MKWINPGILAIFDSYGGDIYQQTNDDIFLTTNLSVRKGFNEGFGSFTKKIESSSELWISFDFYMIQLFAGATMFYRFYGANNKTIITIRINNDYTISILDSNEKQVYISTDKICDTKKVENIEIHIKIGEEGRIDIWKNMKMFLSYRSPSLFSDNVEKFYMEAPSWANLYFSSFIIQNTGRIGLQKFKKLTISPDTEQNIEIGFTTTFNLSGLSDATEFSDITSVCAVLQATSRDTNITTGTFSLDGNDIGTIDVSDSSGKAYEIAHSETNSATGKSWTAADIEGKTLSFKVNGAE